MLSLVSFSKREEASTQKSIANEKTLMLTLTPSKTGNFTLWKVLAR
jgi:hypothetical protein